MRRGTGANAAVGFRAQEPGPWVSRSVVLAVARSLCILVTTTTYSNSILQMRKLRQQR